MPRKDGTPKNEERLVTLEVDVKYIVKEVGEIKKDIREVISPLLQNHDRKITRNSTILKILIGTPVFGGGLYGLISFLG